jgi:hypothetical protein
VATRRSRPREHRFEQGLAKLADERDYEDWLRMRTTDFLQADLAVGPAEDSGFHQCAVHEPSRCNLLLQLRCGLHIGIRGQGIARREDADAILRGLGRLASCQTQ